MDGVYYFRDFQLFEWKTHTRAAIKPLEAKTNDICIKKLFSRFVMISQGEVEVNSKENLEI